MPIIDLHCHVFPYQPEKYLSGAARDRVKKGLRPLSRLLHQAKPWVRLLPGTLRKGLSPVEKFLAVPFLAAESNEADFDRAMKSAAVSHAVVIAHSGSIPNDFVLDLSKRHANWFPAVNLGTDGTPERLRQYHGHGAKFLKIHAEWDGKGADFETYLRLLREADSLGMPVILHLDSHAPDSLTPYRAWFEKHSSVPFFIAHMNLDAPEAAFDVMEKYPNVLCDTSWQPVESIVEAVRRVGSERIFFGSDWPLMGDNIAIGIERIGDAAQSGFISNEDAENIFYRNATRLLTRLGEFSP